ncbi:urea ABC transporter ATP-binding subunit UrtE [Tistrella mobilis]|jgi:urea transport system ATP-binding protein|uniref:ABC transporter ATP-binding component n=1 Tax=Tistrella mobilis (strain KA081020-065) TaxID=1110502 RepID=I3TUP6_TISMK|nr:urea ABC transporter ATP-binding subunit UrtE [Tistrella mobilis]AFK56484.1 putative ABC transporter ATP-binding component [Tistrella mobilis KA081020-065]MAM74833.1 urea ABC transporter ATP-binding subunit UrtE [Tistrella sp.]
MLTVDDLTVAYGQSEVLHGLSLSAAKAEIVAVMGRNGMGKTTLMKSLIGILPARGGRIRLGEAELVGTEPHQRVREGLAFVPQGRMIFPTLTVEENIRTGLVARGRRHIPDDIYSLFPVLHEMRRRRGGNLSGGQQQQLAIARALVAEPRVLLLDEPTEGIQPSIIKDMARSLREIRDMMNLTILVSEQVLSFALDVADRFLVIENGRLVHEDRRADVNEARISAYLSV